MKNHLAISRMKKYVGALALTSAIGMFVTATPVQANQWTKIWGAAPFQSTYYGGDDAVSAMVMDNYNYIHFTGVTNSYQFGGIVLGGQTYNAVVGKMDTSGNILWSDEIGVDAYSDTQGKAIGYDKYGNTYSLLYNWCSPAGTGCDLAGDGVIDRSYYIMKHDYYGNRVWTINIGLQADFDAVDMLVDKYANIFVAGTSPVNGIKHVAMKKYDYWGNQTASMVYPTDTDETAVDIASNIDNFILNTINTVVIAFEKKNPASGSCCDYTDMGVKRIYGNLSLNWSNTTHNPYWEHPRQVVFNRVTNEVMVFGGEAYDTALIAGFSGFSGNLDWFKTASSSLGVIYVNSAIDLSNGEVIATGAIGKNAVRGNGWGNDILFVRFSASGDMLEVRNRGVYGVRDTGYALTVDSGENYYVGGNVGGDLDGQTATPNSGTSKDFIMFKNRP